LRGSLVGGGRSRQNCQKAQRPASSCESIGYHQHVLSVPGDTRLEIYTIGQILFSHHPERSAPAFRKDTAFSLCDAAIGCAIMFDWVFVDWTLGRAWKDGR
jgi:hypothetical protein